MWIVVRPVGNNHPLVRHPVPPDCRGNRDSRFQVREARKDVLEVSVLGPVFLVQDGPNSRACRVGHDEPVALDIALVGDAEGKNEVVLHTVEVRRNVFRSVCIQGDRRRGHVAHADGDIRRQGRSPRSRPRSGAAATEELSSVTSCPAAFAPIPLSFSVMPNPIGREREGSLRRPGARRTCMPAFRKKIFATEKVIPRRQSNILE